MITNLKRKGRLQLSANSMKQEIPKQEKAVIKIEHRISCVKATALKELLSLLSGERIEIAIRNWHVIIRTESEGLRTFTRLKPLAWFTPEEYPLVNMIEITHNPIQAQTTKPDAKARQLNLFQ